MLSETVKDVGKLTFGIIATLADAAPSPMRGAIVVVCALLHYLCSPGKRRNVAENVAATGRQATRLAVFNIFRLHAANIYELFASSRWKDETLAKWFEFEGREELNRALAEGKGVILITGHVGSWELSALYLQSLGYNLHVVTGVQMNRLLTGAVKEAKEKRGIEVIHPNGSYRQILKVFQCNGILALLIDGNVYSGGVEWQFFGRKTRLPDGPVRLAKASGAPIIAGYSRRLGKERFKICVESIVNARQVEELSEGEMLATVYRTLERFIADNADQWCMFRRIWGA